MPFISARAAAAHKDYDVIVVGSGAGGGQIAYTLTMEGVRVLMLEAGRKYDASAEEVEVISTERENDVERAVPVLL